MKKRDRNPYVVEAYSKKAGLMEKVGKPKNKADRKKSKQQLKLKRRR